MKKKEYIIPKLELFLFVIEEGIGVGSQIELENPIVVEDWEEETDTKYFDFD